MIGDFGIEGICRFCDFRIWGITKNVGIWQRFCKNKQKKPPGIWGACKINPIFVRKLRKGKGGFTLPGKNRVGINPPLQFRLERVCGIESGMGLWARWYGVFDSASSPPKIRDKGVRFWGTCRLFHPPPFSMEKGKRSALSCRPNSAFAKGGV
jgi:hypothetical protein